MLADAIARIAADRCPSAVIRRDEAGEPAVDLWNAIAGASLDRATAPEAAGGSGLGWREVLPLVLACGEHALPAPLADSLGAHALAAAAGCSLPQGSGSFALLQRRPDGALVADAVPWGDRVRSVVGVLADGELLVLDATGAKSEHRRNPAGEGRSTMVWTSEDHAQPPASGSNAATSALNAAAGMRDAATDAGDAVTAVPDVSAGHDSPTAVRDFSAARNTSILASGHLTDPGAAIDVGAALRAAQLAGAMRAALRMTLRYAGDREQFGRPIGRFQAVQQQLALMAELVAQASIGAELAFDCDGPLFDPIHAACAKQVASANALQCAAIAHAVHGAIGITAEYDLQLYSRRLRVWAAEWGGAHHWALTLARGLLRGEPVSLWHAVVEVSTAA